MALNAAYEGSATIGATEFSLTSGSTTLASQAAAGIYQLFLDLSALAAGDSYVVRVREKVTAAEAQQVIEAVTVSGPQATPVLAMPALLLMRGFDFTVQKLAGTDRALAWSIRQVA